MLCKNVNCTIMIKKVCVIVQFVKLQAVLNCLFFIKTLLFKYFFFVFMRFNFGVENERISFDENVKKKIAL